MSACSTWIFNRLNMAATHVFPVRVDPADIDFMGHVNNAVYLRWVQDAVVAHWRAVAPPRAIARHLWIALKHEITFHRSTFLDDDLVVTVVLERLRGARAFYRTTIMRDGDLLAEASSCWCSVDAATRRPVRLGSAVAALFLDKTQAPD